MSRTPSIAVLLAASLAAVPAHALQRVFVASTGSDANTCTLASPCRSFAAAINAVDPGGEIVAMDAAGYGAVTIAKSVTITANPGFYAGIAASMGDAVTIATPGVNVVLRSLNINGIGAANGVNMTDGSSLAVENCIVSNFTASGIFVGNNAKVRVVDSVIRGNNNGVWLQGGASGAVATSKLSQNGFLAIVADGAVASTTTTVVVSDTVVDGNQFGIFSRSEVATGATRVSVVRTTVSNTGSSAVGSVSFGGGAADLILDQSMVTANAFGLFQQGAGSVLRSLGNNAVGQNGTDVTGTVSSLSAM